MSKDVTDEREQDWFDEFWSTISIEVSDEDYAVPLAALFAQLIDADMIWRDGDKLVGRNGDSITLDRDVQYLVRCIEDAAIAAGAAVMEDK